MNVEAGGERQETPARAVRLSRRGALAVITIDNPPVNALSHPVRAGLMAALAAAEAEPSVLSVLIRAAGRTFAAGGDIREFETGRRSPLLSDVCARVAESRKPVAVHLHGAALGGGLELALAAGLRTAAPGTRLGLPEVGLGLCPGAGGTQRLPRLVGAAAALDLMLGGETVTAERALSMGLIDAVATEAEAEALCAALGEGGLPARAARDSNATYLAAVASARAGLRSGPARRLPAPRRIIDCVEAAILLPPAAARVMEETAFSDLIDTPESRALRHMFLAERRAGHHPRTDGITTSAPARVAVAGGGAAGADLAAAFLGAWMTVSLGAEDADALASGLARIAAGEEMAVEAGRMTPEARDAEWARLSGGIGLQGFATADAGVLVGPRAAEAARAAAQALPAGAVLVLADVAGDLPRHAAASGRGGDVIGLTLSRPTGQGPQGAEGALAEVLAPPGASAQAVATGVALALAVKARAVVTRVPLAETIAAAVERGAAAIVDLGAQPYAVDRALLAWGLPEAPFAARDRMNRATDAYPAPAAVMRQVAEALDRRGRTGFAAGAGLYLYDAATGTGTEDQELASILSAARAVAGRPVRPARTITGEAVTRLVLAVMANEGARLCRTQAIARPSDFDVAAVLGTGFPRWLGGPMQAADEAGLLGLRNLLARAADEMAAGELSPDPLWDDLIRNGRRFADLNEA